MKKSFMALFIGMGLILGLLFSAPYFFPLESVKKKIENTYKEATGQKLHLKGPLTFSILPFPQITFEDVLIFPADPDEKTAFADIKKAHLTLSLSNLFLGNICISSLSIEQPSLNLKRNKNGRGNWETGFLGKSEKEEERNFSQKESLYKAPKVPLKINTIVIKDGNIFYSDRDQLIKLKGATISLNIFYGQEDGIFVKSIEFESGGMLLEEKLELRGKIENLDQKEPILSFLITAFGEKINLDGRVSLERMSFIGKASTKGVVSESSLLSCLPVDAKSLYSLGADVDATLERIKVSDISLRAASLEGKGTAFFDILHEKSFLQMQFTPGDLFVRFEKDKDFGDKVIGQFKIECQNLKSILQALTFHMKEGEEVPVDRFSLSALIGYQDDVVDLQNITLKIGHASLQGGILFKNLKTTPQIIYNMAAVGLGSLPEFKGIRSILAGLGDTLKIKGESSREKNTYITHTQINGDFLEASLEGSIAFEKGLDIDLQCKVSGKKLNTLLRTPALNLGFYKVFGVVKGDLSHGITFKISDSEVHIGKIPTRFQGDGFFTLHNAKPTLKGKLILDTLNLEGLSSSKASDHYHPPSKKSSQPSSTSLKSSPVWSHEDINFSFLKDAEGDMDLSIQKVLLDSFVLSQMQAHLHLEKGILTVDPCKSNVVGGEATAFVQMSADAAQNVSLKLSLQNAHLKSFDFKSDAIKIVSGDLNLKVDLASFGKSLASYVQNLNGSLQFQGRGGKIAGFSLSKISSALTQAQDLSGFLGLLSDSFKGGETSFSQLEGHMEVQKGHVTLEKCILGSDPANISATGAVNLPQYTMDILGTIQLNIKGFPAFFVKLKGPLDAPTRTLDTGNVQNYLLQNVFTNIVGMVGEPVELVGGLIGDIFGGGGNNPSKKGKTSQRGASENSSKNPQNLVQSGLKALGF